MEQNERRTVSFLLLFLLFIPGEGRIVEVLWSSSNPLLHQTLPVPVNQDLETNAYDQAHFICPETSPVSFSVYSVPRDDYESCTLLSPKER